MDAVLGGVDVRDELLVVAARLLTGRERRVFQGRVCRAVCAGNARQAERRFGWGRENVATGLRELEGREPEPDAQEEESAFRRGRLPSEKKNPQLAADIRLIVEPHTHSDPELKTSRQYTNPSAAACAPGTPRAGLRGLATAERADDSRHLESPELSPELSAEADSEREAAEEDAAHGCDFRLCPRGPRQVRG